MNLTLSGGPLAVDGTVEQLALVITVLDNEARPVTFDDDNVMRSSATRTQLAVVSGTGTLRVFLPEGTLFTFSAAGFVPAATPNAASQLVAYGEASRLITAATSNATNVHLISLLGSARLEPRLPTRFVVPGQELDVMLSATAPDLPDLAVPLTDYLADYGVSNGVALAASERGMRLRVGDRDGGDVVVDAGLTGLVLADEVARPGTITASLSLPFATSTKLDTEPPTIADLAFDGVQHIFTGVADDNMGVARVSLFDGPVLLATTDLAIAEEQSLPIIEFPGGGTAFFVRLHLPPGEVELTAFVHDQAGNQTSLSLETEAR